VRARRISHGAGFTLIEAMTAVVIATVACSAMLLAVSQSLQASSAGIASSRANLVATDLMNEISAAQWVDRSDPTHWGPETGEVSAQKIRAAFNDLDDYDGWSGTPQTHAGQTYDTLEKTFFPAVSGEDYGAFTCSVSVQCVSSTGVVVPHDQTTPRRVTVQITCDNKPVATLVRTFQSSKSASVLGSDHWSDPTLVEPIATVQTVP
jgi:Tfp pilus assembly protein PilV